MVTVDGASGDDQVYGEDGDDTLIANAADSVVDGGTGTDRAILDFADVISDASPGKPRGSCESVQRANPKPKEDRRVIYTDD